MTEPNEVSPRNRSSERGVVQSARRIALEILIGFVGVYAAFALSAYKEKRDLVDRRHQIKRALLHEVTGLVAISKKNLGSYGMIADQFDADLRAGKKPIPNASFEPMGLGMHMWEATKQAGGLNLIDVPTFSQIADFYNNWSEMEAWYAQFRDLSIRTTLPGTALGADGFYDPKTGKLRPEIAKMYTYDLRGLDGLTQEGVRMGTALIATLAKDTI